MSLLTRHGLRIAATRSYANKLVTKALIGITKTSSILGRKCIACSGRTGRHLVRISRRALRACNTIDRRATRRVTRNTTGTTGTSTTLDTAKVTKPKNKARRGPINLMCVKYCLGKGAAIGRYH